MADPSADQLLRKIGGPQAKVCECLTAFDESDGRVKTMEEAA